MYLKMIIVIVFFLENKSGTSVYKEKKIRLEELLLSTPINYLQSLPLAFSGVRIHLAVRNVGGALIARITAGHDMLNRTVGVAFAGTGIPRVTMSVHLLQRFRGK